MKSAIVLACILGATVTAPAQVNYYRAQQQAVRASNQNTAEQQRIQGEANGPATPAPAAPVPATPAPMDPALQATLNNINGLQADFAGLVNATDAQAASLKTSLLNHLTEAAQGSKASTETVKRLADDLSVALAGQKKFAAAQQIKVARAVHALFNSAHLSATMREKLLADAQKILTDSGTSVNDAVNVVTDLKAVANETK